MVSEGFLVFASKTFIPLSMINGTLIVMSYYTVLYLYFGDVFLAYLWDHYSILLPFPQSPVAHSLESLYPTTSNVRSEFLARSEKVVAFSLNMANVFATFTLYTYGVFFHGKSGWRFYQPFNGGLGFMLCQASAWICFATALILPWMSVDQIGILPFFNLTRHEPISAKVLDFNFGCMCLISCLFALNSVSFTFISVLMFDKNAENRYEKLQKIFQKLKSKLTSQEKRRQKIKSFLKNYRQGDRSARETSKLLYVKSKKAIDVLKRLSVATLAELDAQKLRLGLINGGNPENNLYVFSLFAILQVLILVYLIFILALVESNVVKDQAVQILVIIFSMILMNLSIFQTQFIGGRIMHGRFFHSILVWKGGWKYIFFQFIAWILFSFSQILTYAKLFHVSHPRNVDSNEKWEPYLLRLPAFLAIFCELSIIMSVHLFDKSKLIRDGLLAENAAQVRLEETNDLKDVPDEKLLMEVREAQLMKIFGDDYDYSNFDSFKIAYLNQRNKILDNIFKFTPPQSERSSTLRNRKAHARNLRDRTQSPTRDSDATEPTATDTENEEVEHVWEEYEDENGNVFYYNVTTGKSYKDLPEHVRQVRQTSE